MRRQNVCARKKPEVPLQGDVIQDQMMDKVWTGKEKSSLICPFA